MCVCERGESVSSDSDGNFGGGRTAVKLISHVIRDHPDAPAAGFFSFSFPH
jgi:hypothetical protein